jgi:glycosyltransferase involved in cell wall biosynthesis
VARSLKFLYLTTFYPPYSFGGDAVYLHRVAHALGDAGHTVDVVHCVDSYHLRHPGEPEIQFAEHPNVTRHELRSPFGGLSPLVAHQSGRPLLTGRRLRQIANSKKFDVVHFHNISLLGPGVLKLTPAGTDFVKLYTTHEHWLVCPMHVLWKFDSRVCESTACLRCTLRGKRPPQLWRHTGYLREAAAHVDQFVSPSRFTARIHAERGFSEPVDVLPYFMARQDQDWRNPAPRPQERPYFLFVGRLEKLKGLHTLIEAWAKVTEWDLLVAGTGSAEMDLRAQASTNPRIRFLGAQSQQQLGALYTHAVASIVPSVTYETFGMVLIESFARKTPVIVRDLGALPEVVEDSGGGKLYRDNEELLRSVELLARAPALRGELGERGYRAFLRLWTTEAHFEQYFGFINSARVRKFGSTDEWQITSSQAVRASSARI